MNVKIGGLEKPETTTTRKLEGWELETRRTSAGEGILELENKENFFQLCPRLSLVLGNERWALILAKVWQLSHSNAAAGLMKPKSVPDWNKDFFYWMTEPHFRRALTSLQNEKLLLFKPEGRRVTFSVNVIELGKRVRVYEKKNGKIPIVFKARDRSKIEKSS